MLHKKIQSGFTILELLLSMAIIAILGVSATLYFRGSIVEVSLESTIKNFVSDISSARGRSMAGDRGLSFGVRAIPGVGDNQGSWEFFSTTTNTLTEVYEKKIEYLPYGVSWKDPLNNPKELAFTPLSGTTVDTVFEIVYGQTTFRIRVGSNGEITTTRL